VTSTWTVTSPISTPRPADRAGPGGPALISFLSDYGTADEFVGVVHAVLHRTAPGAPVVDVTHHVPRHDVRAAALTLWRAAPWLAPGVLLAVVDPGVGTTRRAVAIEVATAGAVLVGPDNGLLLPAAVHLGPITQAVELPPNPDAPGATFAGRDVFAPAAGRVATGTPLSDLGSTIDPDSLAGEPVHGPDTTPHGIEARVLWVDHFGNAELNATPEDIGPGPVHVQAAGGPARQLRVVGSFEAIHPDEFALVIDSYGYVAICCDRRSAAERLALNPGDPVVLRPGA
jgi:S-adenosyl-L-methionine hydrolase (adenosine-forming)